MAGWPPGSLHLERFTPTALTDEQLADEHEFEVEAAASGVNVTVPVGVPIIRALEQAGVLVETSCEEGICGTCETKVLDGEVDHRDSLLSEDERATGGTMMVCVSRCRGQRLVLDL
jgi:ferredoxin